MFREIDNYKELEELSSYTFSTNDPYHKVIVYYEEDSWCGFIDYSLIYEKSELNYIFVKEEYRRNKIASKLLEYWLEDCDKNKINSQTLEVCESNLKAIPLYQKYGFSTVAVRKNYYGKENGYLMMREVSE